MFSKNTIEKLSSLPTPFYFYDLDVLRETCEMVRKASETRGYMIHYAVKANPNPGLLKVIASFGFGADCVSWNEIERAMDAGIDAGKIVFAGVGKTDIDIERALRAGILCFNCESIPEIEVINSIAGKLEIQGTIALRINPYIDAHTHRYITTAIEESKFGINTWELDEVLKSLEGFKNITLKGIHFHVGSQILKMSVFKALCSRINELQGWFSSNNINLEIINVGGGLGIDYEDPAKFAKFEEYFSMIGEFIDLKPGQRIHFEPGRALVGQCGSLISRVLYVKKGSNTKFAIIDAGMNDLIRPALYQSLHKIENLTSTGSPEHYDIVGPICESADTFAKYTELPEIRRGDILAIHSAGAYGESMASRYNLRDLIGAYFSDDI